MKSNTVENIWEKYHSRLKQYIGRKIFDTEMVDDILQDIFVKIQININTLNDKNKLEPWIFKIAKYTIIDFIRSKKKKYPDLETNHLNPLEEKIETKQGIESLKSIIKSLPPKYAQVLMLSEFQNLSSKQIAQKSGLSVAGTKSRIQRAKKMLNEKLKIYCIVEYDKQGTIVDYNCTDCFSKNSQIHEKSNKS